MTTGFKVGVSVATLAGIGLAAGVYAWTRTRSREHAADGFENSVPVRAGVQVKGWTLSNRDLLHDLNRLPR